VAQVGENSHSNENRPNNLKRKITTSGNNMPLGQASSRYMMTNRD
jgi:hypothetical protein